MTAKTTKSLTRVCFYIANMFKYIFDKFSVSVLYLDRLSYKFYTIRIWKINQSQASICSLLTWKTKTLHSSPYMISCKKTYTCYIYCTRIKIRYVHCTEMQAKWDQPTIKPVSLEPVSGAFPTIKPLRWPCRQKTRLVLKVRILSGAANHIWRYSTFLFTRFTRPQSLQRSPRNVVFEHNSVAAPRQFITQVC